MPLPTSRELREMLHEATPAPWWADEAATCERCAHVRASATLVCSPDMADAPLIALAPQLAEEVIRLREEIDRHSDADKRLDRAAKEIAGMPITPCTPGKD